MMMSNIRCSCKSTAFRDVKNFLSSAQKQCVCGGSEFAINILKQIGLISEKSRAVPKLKIKVSIIVI